MSKYTYNLYNKTIRLTFDEDAHKYTVNGKVVVSPSSILSRIAKPYLARWGAKLACDHIKDNLYDGALYSKQDINELIPDAIKAHQDKAKVATDFGTRVHLWLENYIKGKETEVFEPDSAEDACIQHLLKWQRENNVEFLMSEKKVYSIEDNLAGTADVVFKMNGELFLGDFKTSKQISEDYYLQLSFYAKALEEMNSELKFDKTAIILMTKTREFQVCIRENWRSDYLIFKKLLEVVRWLDKEKTH